MSGTDNDTGETYYTLSEVARLTNITFPTLRRYINGNQPLLGGEKCVVTIPSTVVNGRHLYTESSIEVIKSIYDRSDVGKARMSAMGSDRVVRVDKVIGTQRPTRPTTTTHTAPNVHLLRPTTVMVEMGVEDIDAILEHLPTTSVLYQRVCAINDSTQWNRW